MGWKVRLVRRPTGRVAARWSRNSAAGAETQSGPAVGSRQVTDEEMQADERHAGVLIASTKTSGLGRPAPTDLVERVGGSWLMCAGPVRSVMVRSCRLAWLDVVIWPGGAHTG